MPILRRRLLTLLPALPLGACAERAERLVPKAGPPVQGSPPPDCRFTMADGTVLPVRIWQPAGPPRAVTLALHGFNDSRDAWEYPAPRFAADGLLVYAPDQRGFGATASRGVWPGTDKLVTDTVSLLAQLRARHPGLPLILMGESMGGAVAMLAAARAPHAMDGTVLLAPAVWGRQQMNPAYTGALWLASRLLPDVNVTGRAVPRRITASDNRAALVRLAQDRLTLCGTSFRSLRGLVDLMDAALAAAPAMPPRTLFLYGAHDQLVPAHATAALWRALPGSARRGFYPDGYHLLLRDHDRARPIADLLAWTATPDQPLPSSAEIAAATWLACDPA